MSAALTLAAALGALVISVLAFRRIGAAKKDRDTSLLYFNAVRQNLEDHPKIRAAEARDKALALAAEIYGDRRQPEGVVEAAAAFEAYVREGKTGPAPLTGSARAEAVRQASEQRSQEIDSFLQSVAGDPQPAGETTRED